MFVLFRFSVNTAAAVIFLAGLITLSDLFLNQNQPSYQILTVAIAAIFFAIGFSVLFFYRNFRNIYNDIKRRKQDETVYVSLQRIMFFLSLMAVIATLALGALCMALIERMAGGTALLG
ncbi:hypothetical protein [Pedobacter frigoris]|uniref:hypothetical protein n=1 Tax=Pedobacter frigoris TaxID=2571272 RepID=UPI00292F2BB1|nr:hypothetical protein [Pedobacter frigoris]